MNRDDFCRLYWSYYLVLEKDFLDTERYISFDLGDNYLYDSHTIHDYGNSGAFSNEFVKQYQAICSEVENTVPWVPIPLLSPPPAWQS